MILLLSVLKYIIYKGSKKYDGFYVIDFNFEKKVVKKYDRFYVIDFNFAKV